MESRGFVDDVVACAMEEINLNKTMGKTIVNTKIYNFFLNFNYVDSTVI